jgi:hypothetical protein
MSEEIKLKPCPFCGRNPEFCEAESVKLENPDEEDLVWCMNHMCSIYRHQIAFGHWNWQAYNSSAHKAGMTEAAEIVKKHNAFWHKYDFRGQTIACSKIITAIEQARDSK